MWQRPAAAPADSQPTTSRHNRRCDCDREDSQMFVRTHHESRCVNRSHSRALHHRGRRRDEFAPALFPVDARDNMLEMSFHMSCESSGAHERDRFPANERAHQSTDRLYPFRRGRAVRKSRLVWAPFDDIGWQRLHGLNPAKIASRALG